jgi:hypothetical protein
LDASEVLEPLLLEQLQLAGVEVPRAVEQLKAPAPGEALRRAHAPAEPLQDRQDLVKRGVGRRLETGGAVVVDPGVAEDAELALEGGDGAVDDDVVDRDDGADAEVVKEGEEDELAILKGESKSLARE